VTTTPKLPEVIAFLKGEGPLDGVWFGEPHPSGKPYWWRTLLPASEAPVAWRAYGPGRWANSWQDGKPTADDLEYSRTRGYAITYAYARAESAAPASVPEGVRELVEALTYYMSQFGQGLEAHGIPFGPTQVDADEKARTALTHPALRAFIGSEK
jgi:hypothetical protein